jgi:DNA-directed RNA polymerase subunit RPC12/RpoP
VNKKLEHLKLDPVVCPHCGSDDTEEIDQGVGREVYDDYLPDEVRRCNECGQEYKVSYVKVLQSVSWEDDEGNEQVLHDSQYLVKEAAEDLVQAADELLANARDNGECFIDQEDDRYDRSNPEQMYPDWAALAAGVARAKGQTP